MKLRLAPTEYCKRAKFGFAAFLLLTFCVAYPSSTAYAKKRKPAKHGIIKIQTSPAGLPIEVDGKPEGTTTIDWRSWDRAPGVHTVVISLPDGQRWTREISLDAGRIKCVALNYRPGVPPTVSPCPYPVNLSAPATVSEGEIITYTADVSYSGTLALNYKWTVSPAAAKVLSGVGTPTITVDSTGLGNQTVSATLVVDDGSGEVACRQVARAATNVARIPQVHREAGEYDVCCSCAFDDQKARLDNLAVELQNDPSATAYIFGYGGRTSRTGEADRLITRARDYLVNQRGIDAARVVVVNGGLREENCVELWIVPSGATPPQPRPTLQPGDARPAPEAPARRRRRA
ncbi:MAG TPA: hypothetical protein VFH15_06405 [Pyrinomonadaceae bacterium]|nr:hypothetical protein [Pyrinomonadaceae bacterium]